jgi:hypothetical protein
MVAWSMVFDYDTEPSTQLRIRHQIVEPGSKLTDTGNLFARIPMTVGG